jgi:[acyl-carrier-protein] S-malonyltransferase
MKMIGLLFPGQGSQYVGMGKDLYDHYPEARETFDRANEILGQDLRSIIFQGPDEVLRQTQVTQPAIFVTSVAAYVSFKGQYGTRDGVSFCCAGHSLGEYSALCAAGVFDLATGLKLVKARGEFIKAASDKNPGTMAAILGLDAPAVIEICRQASAAGPCEAVNFNSPGQIVIAGTTDAVAKAVALAGEKGAMKTVMLNVSGPFHSSLMGPAAEKMRAELAGCVLNAPAVPVFTNCDAQPVESADGIADKLVRQINHPVLWEDTIRRMAERGCDTFIELGPQRVLSGLLRRIDKTKKSYSIEDAKSMEKSLAALQG